MDISINLNTLQDLIRLNSKYGYTENIEKNSRYILLVLEHDIHQIYESLIFPEIESFIFLNELCYLRMSINSINIIRDSCSTTIEYFSKIYTMLAKKYKVN